MFTEVRRIATDKLREAFAEPAPQARPSARLAAPVPALSGRSDLSAADSARRRGDLLSEMTLDEK